ncbi:MAG: hypothetical protein Q8O92_08050, partial [Candidatus Latescibacter sp.]|nr:hypothetical protein [Candidatus Latescibacter sp.]
KGGIMLAGSFYPLYKGVAALCGGGILSLEHINSMAYLSPKKKMGDGQENTFSLTIRCFFLILLKYMRNSRIRKT